MSTRMLQSTTQWDVKNLLQTWTGQGCGNPAIILSTGQGSDVRFHPVKTCEFHPSNLLIYQSDALPSYAIQAPDLLPICVWKCYLSLLRTDIASLPLVMNCRKSLWLEPFCQE